MTDRLSHLPVELLYNIFAHFRGVFFDQPDIDAHRLFPDPFLYHHPLYALAASSHQLRDIVESYCGHLLTTHKKHTKFKPPTTKNLKVPLRARWVKWIDKHCAFCAKQTICKARFCPDLACCLKCEKKRWQAITMTEAMKQHKLNKLDLFTPNPLYDDRVVTNIPLLRSAVYNSVGVEATLFLTDELDRRAKFIHGTEAPGAEKSRSRRRARILGSLKCNWHATFQCWYRSSTEDTEEQLQSQATKIKDLIIAERQELLKYSNARIKPENLNLVDINYGIRLTRRAHIHSLSEVIIIDDD